MLMVSFNVLIGLHASSCSFSDSSCPSCCCCSYWGSRFGGSDRCCGFVLLS